MVEMLEVMLEGNCALISIEGHVLMDENAMLIFKFWRLYVYFIS